jgi:hypothetical protein
MKKKIFYLFVGFILIKTLVFSMIPSTSTEKIKNETFNGESSFNQVKKISSSRERRKAFKRRSSSLKECTFIKNDSEGDN